MSWQQNKEARRAAYGEKLKDPRWQKLRLQVFERDEWRCMNCYAADETLHVHHQYYLADHEPWDYSIDALVTLCETCHASEKDMEAEYAPMLIRTLHDKGLTADSLRELALGFSYMPRAPFPDVLVQALVNAFKRREFWIQLLDDKSETIKEMGKDKSE